MPSEKKKVTLHEFVTACGNGGAAKKLETKMLETRNKNWLEN